MARLRLLLVTLLLTVWGLSFVVALAVPESPYDFHRNPLPPWHGTAVTATDLGFSAETVRVVSRPEGTLRLSAEYWSYEFDPAGRLTRQWRATGEGASEAGGAEPTDEFRYSYRDQALKSVSFARSSDATLTHTLWYHGSAADGLIVAGASSSDRDTIRFLFHPGRLPAAIETQTTRRVFTFDAQRRLILLREDARSLLIQYQYANGSTVPIQEWTNEHGTEVRRVERSLDAAGRVISEREFHYPDTTLERAFRYNLAGWMVEEHYSSGRTRGYRRWQYDQTGAWVRLEHWAHGSRTPDTVIREIEYRTGATDKPDL